MTLVDQRPRAKKIEVVDEEEVIERESALLRSVHGSTVAAIIAEGETLISIRDRNSDMTFARICERAGYKLRTAQHYMTIARAAYLRDAQFIAHLPASSVGLYACSRMKPEDIRAAIDAGVLRPDSELKEIHAFRREEAAKKRADDKAPTDAREISFRVPSDEELMTHARIGLCIGLMACAGNVSLIDICSGERSREVVPARTCAIYLANQNWNIAHSLLAGLFGMDRTNIVHGLKTLEDRRVDGSSLDQMLTRMDRIIAQHFAAQAA